ncbi:unnamed protein product [Symbiodinium sp. KB8]|nr:unnamed protein product [Symbiodinium sp. KB8]
MWARTPSLDLYERRMRNLTMRLANRVDQQHARKTLEQEHQLASTSLVDRELVLVQACPKGKTPMSPHEPGFQGLLDAVPASVPLEVTEDLQVCLPTDMVRTARGLHEDKSYQRQMLLTTSRALRETPQSDKAAQRYLARFRKSWKNKYSFSDPSSIVGPASSTDFQYFQYFQYFQSDKDFQYFRTFRIFRDIERWWNASRNSIGTMRTWLQHWRRHIVNTAAADKATATNTVSWHHNKLAKAASVGVEVPLLVFPDALMRPKDATTNNIDCFQFHTPAEPQLVFTATAYYSMFAGAYTETVVSPQDQCLNRQAREALTDASQSINQFLGPFVPSVTWAWRGLWLLLNMLEFEQSPRTPLLDDDTVTMKLWTYLLDNVPGSTTADVAGLVHSTLPSSAMDLIAAFTRYCIVRLVVLALRQPMVPNRMLMFLGLGLKEGRRSIVKKTLAAACTTNVQRDILNVLDRSGMSGTPDQLSAMKNVMRAVAADIQIMEQVTLYPNVPLADILENEHGSPDKHTLHCRWVGLLNLPTYADLQYKRLRLKHGRAECASDPTQNPWLALAEAASINASRISLLARYSMTAGDMTGLVPALNTHRITPFPPGSDVDLQAAHLTGVVESAAMIATALGCVFKDPDAIIIPTVCETYTGMLLNAVWTLNYVLAAQVPEDLRRTWMTFTAPLCSSVPLDVTKWNTTVISKRSTHSLQYDDPTTTTMPSDPTTAQVLVKHAEFMLRCISAFSQTLIQPAKLLDDFDAQVFHPRLPSQSQQRRSMLPGWIDMLEWTWTYRSFGDERRVLLPLYFGAGQVLSLVDAEPQWSFQGLAQETKCPEGGATCSALVAMGSASPIATANTLTTTDRSPQWVNDMYEAIIATCRDDLPKFTPDQQDWFKGYYANRTPTLRGLWGGQFDLLQVFNLLIGIVKNLLEDKIGDAETTLTSWEFENLLEGMQFRPGISFLLVFMLWSAGNILEFKGHWTGEQQKKLLQLLPEATFVQQLLSTLSQDQEYKNAAEFSFVMETALKRVKRTKFMQAKGWGRVGFWIRQAARSSSDVPSNGFLDFCPAEDSNTVSAFEMYVLRHNPEALANKYPSLISDQDILSSALAFLVLLDDAYCIAKYLQPTETSPKTAMFHRIPNCDDLKQKIQDLQYILQSFEQSSLEDLTITRDGGNWQAHLNMWLRLEADAMIAKTELDQSLYWLMRPLCFGKDLAQGSHNPMTKWSHSTPTDFVQRVKNVLIFQFCITKRTKPENLPKMEKMLQHLVTRNDKWEEYLDLPRLETAVIGALNVAWEFMERKDFPTSNDLNNTWHRLMVDKSHTTGLVEDDVASAQQQQQRTYKTWETVTSVKDWDFQQHLHGICCAILSYHQDALTTFREKWLGPYRTLYPKHIITRPFPRALFSHFARDQFVPKSPPDVYAELQRVIDELSDDKVNGVDLKACLRDVHTIRDESVWCEVALRLWISMWRMHTSWSIYEVITGTPTPSDTIGGEESKGEEGGDGLGGGGKTPQQIVKSMYQSFNAFWFGPSFLNDALIKSSLLGKLLLHIGAVFPFDEALLSTNEDLIPQKERTAEIYVHSGTGFKHLHALLEEERQEILLAEGNRIDIHELKRREDLFTAMQTHHYGFVKTLQFIKSYFQTGVSSGEKTVQWIRLNAANRGVRGLKYWWGMRGGEAALQGTATPPMTEPPVVADALDDIYM